MRGSTGLGMEAVGKGLRRTNPGFVAVLRLLQEYEGRHCDVTITPWTGEENLLSSFAKMLKNVNNEEFRVMTIVGVRSTSLSSCLCLQLLLMLLLLLWMSL